MPGKRTQRVSKVLWVHVGPPHAKLYMYLCNSLSLSLSLPPPSSFSLGKLVDLDETEDLINILSSQPGKDIIYVHVHVPAVT